MAAGWFLLLCGITCPALLPMGLSLFSLTFAELLRLYRKSASSFCLLMVSLGLADVFLISPMLSPGL